MRKIVSISAAVVLVLALSALVHADTRTSHHGQSSVLTFAAGFPESSTVKTLALQSNKLISNTLNSATNRVFLSGIGFNTTLDSCIVKILFGNKSVHFGGNSGTNILTLSSTPISLGFNATVAHPATSERSRSRDLLIDVLPEPATLGLLGIALAGIAGVVRWRRRNENEET